MEENMNVNRGDFIDFMGVGAQHDDDEISPAKYELGPEQEDMNLNRGSDEPGPKQEDIILNRGSDELGPKQENIILNRGSDEHGPKQEDVNLNRESTFTDFMGVGAQHDDDIDIDDPITQKPDPAQVHHHQRDCECKCSDVNNTRPENRVYTLLQLLPTGKVERDRPELKIGKSDRIWTCACCAPGSSMRRLRHEGPVSVTLQLGPPGSSMRRLRQEGPVSVTLQLGPPSDPTSGTA